MFSYIVLSTRAHRAHTRACSRLSYRGCQQPIFITLIPYGTQLEVVEASRLLPHYHNKKTTPLTSGIRMSPYYLSPYSSNFPCQLNDLFGAGIGLPLHRLHLWPIEHRTARALKLYGRVPQLATVYVDCCSGALYYAYGPVSEEHSIRGSPSMRIACYQSIGPLPSFRPSSMASSRARVWARWQCRASRPGSPISSTPYCDICGSTPPHTVYVLPVQCCYSPDESGPSNIPLRMIGSPFSNAHTWDKLQPAAAQTPRRKCQKP